MQQFAKDILYLAKKIQDDSQELNKPPEEGYPAKDERVFPFSIVRGTRGYIEKVVNQINGTYEMGWYDACAVMLRRLIETLIIEAFEANNIADNIKNNNGDYFYLGDLIDIALNEKTWTLGRNTSNALPRLKGIGDRSAHSRRYNAQRGDLEKILDDIRDVVQELVSLAKLK